MSAWRNTLPALLLACTAGCYPWWLFEEDDPPPANTATPEPTPPPADDAPPQVELEAPEWPPMSENSFIHIGARDDLGLARLEVQFRHGHVRPLTGLVGAEVFSGDELGEGFGTLEIAVADDTSHVTHHDVQNFLVDLSPPEITLGQTLLPHSPDAEIEIWAADAWILGSAKLTVGEVEIVHAFEQGYPSTLGVTWDVSLVSFPASELPPGTHSAQLEVADAAGHVTVALFELTLDADPPLVAITAPAEGAQVSGPFEVVIDVSDPGDGPTWVELRLDGTPVGTAVGPTATVSLDASELAPGPATLEAIAHDEAGHQATTSVAITIAH